MKHMNTHITLLLIGLIAGQVVSIEPGHERRRRTTVTPPNPAIKQNEDLDWSTSTTPSLTTLRVQRPTTSTNHSVWQWLDRLRPQRVHGSMQFGPGFSVNFESGWDFSGDRWWTGPNVCTRTEEKESNLRNESLHSVRHHMSVSHWCDDSDNIYKCTTVRRQNGHQITVATIRECCPGYQRSQGQLGCSEVVELSDLLTTIEKVEASEMLRAIDASGMRSALVTGNYTVFVPSNEAFDKYGLEESDLNVIIITPDSDRLGGTMTDLVAGHVTNGFIRSSDFTDEQLLDTRVDKAQIRINIYNIQSSRLMTANCVPLSTSDVLTTNGVIHVVEKVLQPVRETIDQLVAKNPKLTIFRTVLKHLKLESHGQYTLFAPTDEAFNNLKPAIREKILSGEGCGLDVIKEHLLGNLICSGVVEGHRIKTRNVLHRFVILEHSEDHLTVDGAVVIQRDLMATNGVLHVIDDILGTERADDVLDVGEGAGATEFLQMIRESGLAEKLQSHQNLTIFMPTNAAIKSLPESLLESLNKDKAELQRLVEYHVVPRHLTNKDLHNEMSVSTMDAKKEIHVKQYHSFPFARQQLKTVQCAEIKEHDLESCGGVVHVVNKVLVPPASDVLEALTADRKFSQLVALLKSSGLDEIIRELEMFTFFAPTNKAFESLNKVQLEELRNESQKARKILQSHMLADMLCCAGVFESRWMMSSREVNLDGWMISVDKTNGKMAFDHVPVMSCDLTAANGVVHGIDSFAPAVVHRYLARRRQQHGRNIWRFPF